MKIFLANEADTLAFGTSLSKVIGKRCLFFLHGSLGAGKTTLVRGFLRGLGYAGTVKSPTYTLVEEYNLPKCLVIHFDLYRLNDPEELEWIGIRDYFDSDAVCFIEWPKRGAGMLPIADLDIRLGIFEDGRNVVVSGSTEFGRHIIDRMT